MSELQRITESSDTAFTQAAMRWLQALVAAQLPPSTPAPAPPADGPVLTGLAPDGALTCVSVETSEAAPAVPLGSFGEESRNV